MMTLGPGIMRHPLPSVRTEPLPSIRPEPSVGHDPADFSQLSLDFGSPGVVTSGLGDIEFRKKDRGPILWQRGQYIGLGHGSDLPTTHDHRGSVEDPPETNFSHFK